MKRFALALVALAVLTTSGVLAQDAARLFKAAVDLEMVDRNLPAAIELYKKVTASGDRALAAQALLRMAGCHEKLGNDEAQRIYAQLIGNYGEQAAVVAEARARLAPAPLPKATSAPSPFRINGSPVPWPGLLSPDGTLAPFGQGHSIRAIEIASGRETTLSEDACPPQVPAVAPNSLAWSPDGRHLAFSCRRLAPRTSVAAFELRVLTIDGQQVQTLDRYEGDNGPLGFRLAWSPDSQRLVFARRRNPNLDRRQEEVKLATLPSAVTSIGLSSEGEFTNFSWSPDASRLALHTVDREAKRDDVHILTVATGQLHPVPLPAAPWDRGRNWRSLRAWTPADELIVEDGRPAYSGTDVFAARLSDGAVRKVCEGPMGPDGWACGDITPDGRAMVVRDRRSRRLAVRDLTTGSDRPVTIGAGDEMGGTLSSDGRLLAFIANRDGRWALYVVPVDRTPVAQPLFVAAHQGPEPGRLQWSRTGVLMQGVGGQRYRAYRIAIDPGTGTATSLAALLNTDGRNRNTAAISPDGRQIAIWSKDGPREGIAILDGNGAGERLALEYRLRGMAGGIGARMAWTSEQEIVFYDWADERGQWGLTALDVNSGMLRRLPRAEALGREGDPTIRFPYWQFSRGQQEVVYQDGRGLRVRSLTDGAERVLLNGEAEQAVDSWVVSSDGARVAYVHPRFTDPVRGAVGSQLRLLQVDGSGSRTSTATGVGTLCGWSPDGKFLLHFDRRRQYGVLNVETGATAPLLMPDDPLQKDSQNLNPICWNQAVAYAPDGSFLVLTTQQDEDPRWTIFEGVTYDAVVRAMEARREGGR